MIDAFRSEIQKIVREEIRKYVSNRLETSYFGTVTNIGNVSIGSTASVDIGFCSVSAKNLTGASLPTGAKVIVYARGDDFDNAYIGRTF